MKLASKFQIQSSKFCNISINWANFFKPNISLLSTEDMPRRMQALRFSQWWLWSVVSSGIYCCVVRWNPRGISEEHAASSFRVEDKKNQETRMSQTDSTLPFWFLASWGWWWPVPPKNRPISTHQTAAYLRAPNSTQYHCIKQHWLLHRYKLMEI